jgi:hypothetical protein
MLNVLRYNYYMVHTNWPKNGEILQFIRDNSHNYE